MFVKLSSILLVMPALLIAMDPGIPSPKSSPEGAKLRDIVIRYLNENEAREAAAEPVKDSAYFKQQLQQPYRHSVTTPPEFIKSEVLAGPLCVKDDKGVLCAAHIVFMINLAKEKVTKTVNIPGRMESTDAHRPTPVAVAYANLAGMAEEQILLGEQDGRILIADPSSYLVKTFGKVSGKILGFYIDEAGEKIAVRYEYKDEAHKTIPCFAFARTYEPTKSALELSAKSLAINIAQSEKNKRRSWAPPARHGQTKEWSHFAVQSCNHEVKHITFEEDYCVTHCATGNIEKWIIENIDTEPELVKVATIEQLKP